MNANKDAAWWVENVLAKHKDRITHAEGEHILDYFHAHPTKRLRKMSVEVANRLAKEWTERLMKKGRGVVEGLKDVEIFMEFQDGSKVVCLKSKDAFFREGNLMSHCVASYANKSQSKIYSLRDARNNPHCTIEISVGYNNVQQIKGKANGPVHPKYVEKVLAFLDKIEAGIRPSEMESLGYISLSDETWDLLDLKSGVKKLVRNRHRYFCLNSKIED